MIHLRKSLLVWQKTIEKFSNIWDEEKGKTDLIICLGDRYEMFAAVTASVPFNIPIAHIHGGETTLGAIDNVFRHSITLMSTYHFTSTENHKNKVIELTSLKEQVLNVGSLSLDNLSSFIPLTEQEFMSKFDIDLSIPTVLVTVHPETVSYQRNEDYALVISDVFQNIKDFQILITKPNADTMGSVIRTEFEKLDDEHKHIIAVENLGLKGYFSAMHHAKFLLGNTSSGIIEAASFNKYVINLGDRQKGRDHGDNVIHSKITYDDMMNSIEKVKLLGSFEGVNIYRNDSLASNQIINYLKSI